jgi:3-oxoacyl-[acyl-carrier protein] reductase
MKKKAVIIGATGNIGTSCTLKLAEIGYDLVLIGRSKKSLSILRKKLNQFDIQIFYYLCDFTNINNYSKLLKKISKMQSKIDCIIFCAGKHGNSWANLTPKRMMDTINVNFLSAFITIKELEFNINNDSITKIVLISSLAAEEGYPKIDYSVSKAAINCLVKSLAVIFKHSNIRINAVAPGPVEGRMTRGLDRERSKYLQERIPIGRFSKPFEIANVVTFLASDESNYINGSIIDVTGGLSCMIGL